MQMTDAHGPKPRISIAAGDAEAGVRDAVGAGLSDYNRRHTAGPNRASLVVSAATPDGVVIGGLVGETAWGWLYVDLLWVDDAYRGSGIGRDLLRQAENEAIARRCIAAYLDTFDFQARPFYERLGYTVFAVQDNYPVGHQRFYLQKTLTTPAAPAA